MCIPLLSTEQRSIYNRIIASSLGNSNEKCFFSGKTFTYSAIIGRLRSMSKIVIVVASSGIAAYLLWGRRTAHSRFKIPLQVASNSLCNISKQSFLSALIRQATLILNLWSLNRLFIQHVEIRARHSHLIFSTWRASVKTSWINEMEADGQLCRNWS